MASLSNNELTLTIKSVDNASRDLNAVRDRISGLGDEAGKSSGLIDRVGGAVSSLAGIAKTAALAVGAAAVAVGTAGTTIGIGFNSSVEQAQTKLMAFMKDGAKVAQTLAWVKDEAAKTQFSFTDMAEAAANLTPVAKTSGASLESLVQQAEVLAALNPAEGLVGATFALREALSGDWVSIVERFNLPRLRINELKDQGVPAMEIIRRTLNEMGIDYGLVSAQGQTLSARFDQVKDKLTMMAGAATKPIFDRISKEFDKVGQINFQEWGERAADGVQNVMGAFDLLASGNYTDGMFAKGVTEDSEYVNTLLSIRETAISVYNFLKPAFEELGRAVREDLFPPMKRFYDEVVVPLAPVVGGILVGSVYALIFALSGLASLVGSIISVATELYHFFAEDLPSAFGSAFTWMGDRVTWLKDHFWETVGAIIGFFLTLPFKLPLYVAQAIGAIIGFLASIDWHRVFFSVGIAALRVFDSVRDAALQAFNFIRNINWGDVLASIGRGVGNAILGMLEGAINGALNGIPGAPKVKLPRFARGTNYAPGGLAIVGEEGPEIINLPRGSQVTPARETERALSGGGGNSITIGEVHVHNEADEDRLIRALGMRLALR